MIGRLLSSWEGSFSGAMLVSGRVNVGNNFSCPHPGFHVEVKFGMPIFFRKKWKRGILLVVKKRPGGDVLVVWDAWGPLSRCSRDSKKALVFQEVPNVRIGTWTPIRISSLKFCRGSKLTPPAKRVFRTFKPKGVPYPTPLFLLVRRGACYWLMIIPI